MKPLSEDLQFWRAERPDEWTMDNFIQKATSLEEEIADLKDELRLNTMKFNIIQEIVREALDGIE